MLDIGHAQHGQRDDRAARAPAALTQRGNGKRKATDELDAPQAAKRLRLEPSARPMDNIAATPPAEDVASRLGNFHQKTTKPAFRLIIPPETATGGEGLRSILDGAPAFMTHKMEKHGALTMRHTVLARDDHARRKRKVDN
ncbi:hypothetical protein HYPSUDRAFT_36331 [Hypholoma sublateritium FD-334 SS-4]|uniref:Uncharacterized protein n=1 Tax=Hypholoma sublateritium (strain FD-334 SS-4) TaxID=945553 RepID=A0A0D2LG89_HYPSF|nr:hypothetical protein HYPSUDRAFT_36331 [Hypholoma sublateritium FD-334 SS-4]